MAINEKSKIWEGVYASFAEASADQAVFEGDIWLGKIVDRAHQAISASRADRAIEPIAETRDYALPIVAALAAQRDIPLRILDFGGGMATSYLPLVKMLLPDQPLEFDIIENEAVCRAGRELFADDSRLRFRSDVPGPDERYDIVHCGSSLHYVDDWTGMLSRFAALRPAYLIFVDLPAADNASFVTAQSFHGKRIPVHFWNFGAFVAAIGALGYALAFKARYRNPSFDTNFELANRHFNESHRLGYFAQLIFRPTFKS